MAHNIEIKALAPDLAAVRQRAEAIADGPARVLEQEDTFFYCERGRLKLRRLSPGDGELIHYFRSDTTEPTGSDYVIARTSEPGRLVEALDRALGLRGVVRKRRTLLLVGQTRIHLDEVDGLGDFVELEVVLEEGQSAESGERLARQLMASLGIDEGALVERAYIDLIVESEETGQAGSADGA